MNVKRTHGPLLLLAMLLMSASGCSFRMPGISGFGPRPGGRVSPANASPTYSSGGETASVPIVAAVPKTSPRGTIPAPVIAAAAEQDYDQALNGVEAIDISTIPAPEGRLEVLAWRTILATANGQRADDAETFEAFEAFNALTCLGLSTAARSSLILDAFDDEEDVDCPEDFAQASGALSPEGQYLVGQTLLTVGDAMWVDAAQRPEDLMSPDEILVAALKVQNLGVQILTKTALDRQAGQDGHKALQAVAARVGCLTHESTKSIYEKLLALENKRNRSTSIAEGFELMEEMMAAQRAFGQKYESAIFEAARGNRLKSFAMTVDEVYVEAEAFAALAAQKFGKNKGNWLEDPVQCSRIGVAHDIYLASMQSVISDTSALEKAGARLLRGVALIQGDLDGDELKKLIEGRAQAAIGTLRAQERRYAEAEPHLRTAIEAFSGDSFDGDKPFKSRMGAVAELTDLLRLYASVPAKYRSDDDVIEDAESDLWSAYDDLVDDYDDHLDTFKPKTGGWLARIGRGLKWLGGQRQASEALDGLARLNAINQSGLEKRRAADNKMRRVQLLLAHLYVTLGNFERAQELLAATAPFGKTREDNRFDAAVMGHQWYVVSQMYRAQGKVDAAIAAYETSVATVYGAGGMSRQVGANWVDPAKMGTDMAGYALENGREKKTLAFIELMRDVTADSAALQGDLSKGALKARQDALTAEFAKLRAAARAQAQGDDEGAEFAERDELLTRYLTGSRRASESPLSPMYAGLGLIENWVVNKRAMHGFLRRLTTFVALWRNRRLAVARADFLVAHGRRAIRSLSEVKGDDDWGVRELSQSTLSGGLGGVQLALVDEALAALDKDTSFISFWLAPAELFIVAGHQGALRTRRFDLAANELTFLHDELDLESPQMQIQLFNKLVAPFQDVLRKRVVILANGSMRTLPFAAMKDPKGGAFFGQTYAIRYLPSLAYLRTQRSRRSKRRPRPLVMAAHNVAKPLALALEEAKFLKKTFRSEVYEGHDVDRKVLTSRLPKRPLFHFAGHAIVEPSLPDFSRLIISNGAEASADQRQAGFFIHDIKGLDLSGVDLAVLSACSSGVSPSRHGTGGFSSLEAAFLSAGAGATLSSIRNVDDEQAFELMKAFYLRLKKGMRKDEALQAAQEDVRRMGVGKEWPTTGWAYFTLSGDPAPIGTRHFSRR